MAKRRGGSVTFDQPAPKPKDTMIFAFTSDVTRLPPGNSAIPSGYVNYSDISPGTIPQNTALIINKAGTLSNLIVRGDVTTTVTEEVFTVEINGTSTALTATAPIGSATASNTTTTISVNTYDLISIKHDNNATPSFGTFSGSIYFTPS